MDAGQGQAKFDEGHRHRRLQPNDHRRGSKQLRGGGDGANEPRQEGIDGGDGGEIEHHAVGHPAFEDLSEVLLELQRIVVVELVLDGGDKHVAETDDGHLCHYGVTLSELTGCLVLPPCRSTASPRREKARANPLARVARVVMCDRSMPSWTRVIAVREESPTMKTSAPSSRAAETVSSRCWATAVSTTGTPVISRSTISEPVATIRSSSVSVMSWARAVSTLPTMGSARIPSQTSSTGVS